MSTKLWRDAAGSVLVEYSIVFPLFILTMLGTVDAANMLSQWALANKTAYIGARVAVVSNPVAQSITDNNSLFTGTQMTENLGQYCFDFSNGNIAAYCPSASVEITCNATGCNPNTYGFNGFAFTNQYGTGIFDKMKALFPRLQPQNVEITYQINGSGYVGRMSGLPMNVTVKIKNVPVQFYFLPGIMRFFGGLFSSQVNMPEFATTLTSEDMCSGTAPNCDLTGQHS
jgi:hypothetical protein